MNDPTYSRIRAACCEFSGLLPDELDAHAAQITLDVLDARAGSRLPRDRDTHIDGSRVYGELS